MLRWILLLVAAAAFGQEHERVAAYRSSSWRWDTGIDASMTPFSGGAAGSASFGGSLTFSDVWAAAASFPVTWWTAAEEGDTERGPLLVSLSWLVGGADHRWTVRASRAADTWSGDVGVRVSRDPLVWGLAVGGSAAKGSRELSVTFSVQEVLNDESAESYGFTPRLSWSAAGLGISLAVQWTLAWYSADWILSSGVAASGTWWTWLGSVQRTGELN